MKPSYIEEWCLLSAAIDVPRGDMGPKRARGDCLRTEFIVRNCAHWAQQYAQHAEHQFVLAGHLSMCAEGKSLSRAPVRLAPAGLWCS